MTIERNVVSERDVLPFTRATVVVSEDENVWQVLCEGVDCDRVIAVSKHVWRPVNYADLESSDYVQVNYTAAGARRCVSCGPFPSRES